MRSDATQSSRVAAESRIEATLGAQAVSRLNQCAVAVIGLGALGGPVAQHAAMLGVGGLVLIDPDVVGPENLGNQIFGPADVGLSKAEARRDMIARLNPTVEVRVHPCRMEDLGLGMLRACDLAFVCTDSLASRVAANLLFSHQLGIPWVNAAVDGSGERMFAKVASFGGAPGAPCLACAYGDDVLNEHLESARGGCRTWWGLREDEQTLPTLSASPEAAVAAGLQVLEGLRRLLGHVPGELSREILVDLDAGEMRKVALRRNARCAHTRLDDLTVLGAREAVTVGQTFRAGSATVLRLHGRRFISAVPCVGCGRETPVGRVDTAVRPETLRCAGCGRLLTPTPLSLHDVVTAETARSFLDRNWAEAGLPAGDVIAAEGARGTRHFVLD